MCGGLGKAYASGMKVLILGGTTEASALARALAGDARFEATLSLAGRTRNPVQAPIAQRVGGFGGSAGLAAHLRREALQALIAATHPYAAQMARNAVAAAADVGLPFLALRRPPWLRQPGDRWRAVADAAAAVAALGTAPRRVFLAMGRQELAPFAAAPQHDYLIRSVDHPGALPLPKLRVITARGPFDAAEEERLLRDAEIEVLVAKNSGGSASYGKISAARRLGLPVVLLERPLLPSAETVATAEAAMAWLATHHEAAVRRGL
ncbi:MAG: cobalt-precorrin-6A reductase [Rhodospirillales bacterium]